MTGRERIAQLFLLLSVATIGVLGTLHRHTPTAPRVSAEDPLAESHLRARLGRLLDGRPHPVGSDAQEALKVRIARELQALDLEVERWTRRTCSIWRPDLCADVETLAVAIPGTTGSWVMVNAHTDSARRSPGAADAGIGVAIAIAIAEQWREGTPGHGLWVVLDEGEELGLLGARSVIQHPRFAETLAVVSLEARGSSGVSQLFRSLGETGDLLLAYAAAAPHPVVTTVSDHLFEFMPNDTNLTVFAEAGVPGVDFAFAEQIENYHTPGDTLANLDPRSAQSHADNAAAITAALLDREPGSGRRSAFDVAGLFVVHWPLGWTLPLAVGTLMLTVALCIRSRRRWRQGLGAGALVGATLAVSLLAGGGALAASPLSPFWSVPALGVLIGVIVLLSGWRARPATDSVLDVLGLLWSTLALLLALVAPGAAYLFLLPALCTVIGRPLGRWSPALLLLVGSLVWWPAADGFRTALGSAGLPLSAFALWVPLAACVGWSGRAQMESASGGRAASV